MSWAAVAVVTTVASAAYAGYTNYQSNKHMEKQAEADAAAQLARGRLEAERIRKDGKYAALPDHRVRPRAPPRGSGIAAWSSYLLERLHYAFTPTYLERLPDTRPGLDLSRVKDTVEPMEVDEDVIG